MPSLPQRILQKFADVDYSTDMALVALFPYDNTAQRELVAIAQWISDPLEDGMPEIAFQVRDDWQGEGLGTYLFLRLVKMAQSFGITRFKADVLADNVGMRGVFRKAGVSHTSRAEFGVITYKFDLQLPEEKELD